MTTSPLSALSVSALTVSAASRRLAVAAVLVTLMAVPLASWLAADWAGRVGREALRTAARGQLALYAANLTSELERHHTVPFVLARDADIVTLLDAAGNADLAGRMNRKLEAIAEAARASAVYVMDGLGTTVAASNWNIDTSFVGENFAYRPYFQEAMRGGEGRSFALGTTSHVPGYYIAYPVRAENRTRGAVVLKVGMEDLERTWAKGAERVIVTDPDGVVLITNTPGWHFLTLAPLAPDVRARIEAGQLYADARLDPLPLTGPVPRGEGEVALRSPHSVTEGEPEPPARYFVQAAAVPGTDWTLHVWSDLDPVGQRTSGAAVTAGFGALGVVFVGYGLAHRRIALRERLEEQRRAREDLEARVRDRTRDLTAANDRLRDEVRERERAQEVLKAAQNELVQAAKLAALGQMSAGIVHEVNQPLAAIRAFADNAVILLERGRADSVRANLAEIADLTERMARITRQLKAFARRSADTLEPVAAQNAMERALSLVAARVRAERVDIVRTQPEAPVWVLAEDVRLQQVLVNLFRNALDAMKGAERRVLEIGLAAGDDGTAVLAVRDTGTGIADAHLPQLFDPFFTTKEAGEGLGLGLSISYGIVRDFGGSLAAANHAGGGALFTITLQRAEPR